MTIVKSDFKTSVASPAVTRASKRKTQRGISLPLIAIVLGVSAVITIGAILYGPRYFIKAKVSNEITALTDLRANVVAYGSKVGLFTATNSALAALVGQNMFPPAMVSGTAGAPVVTNQWGGAITVAVGTIVTAGDSLVFTQTGIPNIACSEIATSLDNIVSVISINSTATKTNGSVSNPVTVGTSCSGATDNNTLALTMAK